MNPPPHPHPTTCAAGSPATVVEAATIGASGGVASTTQKKFNNKELAALQLVNFFVHDEDVKKKAIDLATGLGLTMEVINQYLLDFEVMGSKIIDAFEEDFGGHDEDGDIGDEDIEKQLKKESIIKAEKDFDELVRAGVGGKLLFFTWRKQDPSHWRVVRFPPLDQPEIDKVRCEYLEQLAPHMLCTLIHNSIVNIDQKATQALHTNWLKGFHFSVGAYTPIFNGDEEFFERNYLLQALFTDVHPDFGAIDPKTWKDENMMELRLGDDSLPDKKTRLEASYQQMIPHRQRFPSINELRQRMTEERFEQLLQYSTKNGIPHHESYDNILQYLNDIEGLHVLMPPNLLEPRYIASNPHLFNDLDMEVQIFKLKKEEATAAAADTTGNEEMLIIMGQHDEEEAAAAMVELAANSDSANDNNDNNNNNDNQKTPRKSVNNYRKIINEQEDADSQAKALIAFLEVEIMDMLRGKKEGLEDKKYIYAYSNFLRGWLSHLTKQDRSGVYYNSPGNVNGRSINVGLISAKYMKMVGVEALGAYDSRGHEFILRMRFAVPINLNMIIANGPIDRPMTGSKMIVYGDDHLPCPLEVHWMEMYE